MACECQEPCEPQPYRCECERDCWMGSPGAYAACMETCDTNGCEFPDKPGLPSRGAECPDPVVGMLDCTSACALTLSGDFDSCFAAFEGCEGESCAETLCSCQNNAQQAHEGCRNDCERDFEYPGVLACEQTAVDNAEACCNVTLSTCYAPCEDAFIASASVVEFAYLLCVKGKNTTYPAYFSINSEGMCVADGLPNFISCERERVASMAPVEATRTICRATCEKAEIARDTPADRKYPECGGQYHLCKDTCQAEFETAVAAAAYMTYPCIEPCTDPTLTPAEQTTCVSPCYSAYRLAYAQATADQAECRLTCCKDEYEHARNGHESATCEISCYEPRVIGEVTCYGAFKLCESEALAAADDIALAACHATWCTCYDTFMSTYDFCRNDCAGLHPKGDCPDCFEDAISEVGSGDFGYGGVLEGMPVSGVGLVPTDCIA